MGYSRDYSTQFKEATTSLRSSNDYEPLHPHLQGRLESCARLCDNHSDNSAVSGRTDTASACSFTTSWGRDAKPIRVCCVQLSCGRYSDGGDRMAETAGVVIIGGGVMGCSILYNLAARGVTDTVLLERDVLASGSTGRSQAILRMHYSNEVTTRLAWDSLAIFRDLHEIVGTPSGYTKNRILRHSRARRPRCDDDQRRNAEIGGCGDVCGNCGRRA